MKFVRDSLAVVVLSAMSLVGQSMNITVDVDGFEDQVQPKQEKQKATSLRTIKATLGDGAIEIEGGRSIPLSYTRSQMPWPHVEIVEPVGAQVELYYGERLVMRDEIPVLWKEAKIDEYIKMVVVEDGTTWSVKFQAKKGSNLLIGTKGGSSQPVASGVTSKHFRLARKVFKQGDAINVQFFDMPGNSQDWITAVKVGAANDEWGNWQYTDGEAEGTFALPVLPAGKYEMRAYYNYPAGGYAIQDRLTFTVQ